MNINFLLVAAIIPVIVLCYYIYKKDVNKEPMTLLLRIFFLGFFSAIPVLVLELLLDPFFSTDNYSNFFILFLNTLVTISLVEEGFKWIITKIFGYNNKEFDEIYDIIVYSVFASLGFACIENILYVISYGLANAILRAILSVPGHTCFGIIMGYFLSQAKVNQIAGNKNGYYKHLLLSLIIPIFAHTLYDALLFYSSGENNGLFLLVFFAFYIVMVVVSFQIVDKISNIQQNLNNNLSTGVLKRDESGQLTYQPVSTSVGEINYCPVCGSFVKGYNYCPSCGFKVK